MTFMVAGFHETGNSKKNLCVIYLLLVTSLACKSFISFFFSFFLSVDMVRILSLPKPRSCW